MLKGDNRTQLFSGDKEDLRFLLRLQQERYHHIQKLSQGLFGICIAVLAIAVTVYTAIGDEIIGLPDDPDAYIEVASNTFVGSLTIQWTIGMNYLIAGTLLLLAFTSVSTAISKYIGIFTDDDFTNEIWFKREPVLGPNPVQLSFQEESGRIPFSKALETSIYENQERLDIIYSEYIAATLRAFLFGLLLFMSGMIFYWSSNIEVYQLLLINVSVAIPSTMMSTTLSQLIINDESKAETSLVEEILRKDDKWNSVESHYFENVLFTVMSVLMYLVTIAWVISVITTVT
ncbi:hypothetical protein [Natronorubrum texcoconense]|uniref:Uncharacterized protein n=1 Tax=Natronorubrum texcoconense TaxID=1095776 RepID=A0A1G9G2D9_9EURY|nr:hypothetical protein [Natronorubrum texcoconense]SDK94483.1 hypothetical protein SAMN04515672_4380 [Natronorubrum texcoconense]